MAWLNWPNRITITRILLVAPFVICLLNLNAGWAGWRYLAIVLFAIMAISDAVDGFLARRLDAETPLGRFLDPVGDKLLITSAVVLLSIDATAVSGHTLPSFVPVIAVGKDVLTVIGFGLVHAVTGEFLVRPRTWGKTCTLVQLVMVGYCLVAPDLAPLLPRTVLWVLCWLASGLAVVAVIDYVRIGTRFATERHESMQRSSHDE
jgi:cardiolipin synthase